MLNKYPLWKYVMVVLVLLIGGLYSAPNLYGEDPAIQVSGVRGAEVNALVLDTVVAKLDEAKIEYKKSELAEGRILVRLKREDDQLKAKEAIGDSLGDGFVVALNLAPATPGWLQAFGAGPLKLGLDLRGGVHFLMEVDMKEAMNKKFTEMEEDFKADLREEKIYYRRIAQTGSGEAVRVQIRKAEELDDARRFIEKKYPDLVVIEDSKTSEPDLLVSMTEQKIKETRNYAVDQNITIIRNRVNELGVAEPLVQRQGQERIVVQLPGVQDTARAKEILGATATLEFKMVYQDGDIGAAMNGRVPPKAKLYDSKKQGPVLLEKKVRLTGDHIVDAQSSFDQYGMPQVSISLDTKGGNKMSAMTKDNIGNPMAVVFIEYKPTEVKDKNGVSILKKYEEVISVATIQARLGRNFVITGLDSSSEAHNLALMLRAGALIAPIQIVEERTVGPSLGQENIDAGFNAVMLGFGLVLLFMLVYYKKFGLVANVALAANLVMIIGVMSMIPGATLTLPGIAGIVLTVGMAVDANVLIFERIREELKDNRSPQQAIHHGYDSAFSTIADANITTFIAAVILFAIGTGPIKGFAITLAIGIATSMFTAIVGTRAIVNATWGGKRIEKLSI
ncbi:protein translocase subunit SecD [Psychrosphaera sp. B3R10]|uniref:protein translocase subunit SecD n=1 Tax=unclassified Psychrosphaera TaxID=2641570 RepID=UPI001C0819AF|nr:protein translocase subunit SecD [Psychrosphaera sp. 1_MG-2023]MBU2882943.1 protein translocase subunit SecD [Psychrosphaera sp. I2R16]MBU2991340.1 protein translocase subunit SecD [Psychrosphaera sp. B3R10]MDO6720229.1 protein translocase subunit SecD [Psychrosphaera sp. 1_MG-2023]